MDLSRAKTVLIFVFLVLNIFLVTQLWEKAEITHPYSSIGDQEVEEVKALFFEQGYYLKATLPRHAQRAALLSVNAAAPDRDVFLQAFFPEGEARYIKQDNYSKGSLFYYQGETLEFANNGRVIYRCPKAVVAKKEFIADILLEEEDLKLLGEDFLSKKGLWPEDARFDGVYPAWSGEKVVSFYQEFEGVPVYGSYINLYFRADEIVELNYYWLEPLAFKEDSPLVIPATEALLSFLEAQGRAIMGERDITEVSLGYYTIEYEAQKWDVVPTWRIALSNGRKIYVNAYNGEIE